MLLFQYLITTQNSKKWGKSPLQNGFFIVRETKLKKYKVRNNREYKKRKESQSQYENTIQSQEPLPSFLWMAIEEESGGKKGDFQHI